MHRFLWGNRLHARAATGAAGGPRRVAGAPPDPDSPDAEGRRRAPERTHRGGRGALRGHGGATAGPRARGRTAARVLGRASLLRARSRRQPRRADGLATRRRRATGLGAERMSVDELNAAVGEPDAAGD